MGKLVFESIDRAFLTLDKAATGMPISVPLWFAAALGLTFLTYLVLRLAVLFLGYLYEWITRQL